MVASGLLFLLVCLPLLLGHSDPGHNLVGGPDFGSGDPLPDDEKAVLHATIDEDSVSDLSVDEGEHVVVAIGDTDGGEAHTGPLVELENEAVADSVVGREGGEGDDILGAELRADAVVDLLTSGRLRKDVFGAF